MNTATNAAAETTVANVIAKQLNFWTKARIGVKGLLDMGTLRGSRGTLKLVLAGARRFQVLIALESSDLYTVSVGYVGRGKRAGEWIEVTSLEMVDAVSLNDALEGQYMAAMKAVSK